MDKEKTLIKGLDFSWDEVNIAIKNNALLSIDLEFSRRCNLNCKYCYAMPNRVLDRELSIHEIKAIISEAVELGAKGLVNIGGGEPLMFKHYWDIIEYERNYDLETITFTNGTLIDKRNARRLYGLKENIALKFNSFDEDVQDYLAGQKGTGKRIRIALDNLLEIGYSNINGPKLALETIICKQNYHEIEELYHFCRNNQIIPYIEILTIQGNAIRYKNELRITPEDGYRLFSKLREYDRIHQSLNWPLTPPIAGQTCKRMLYSAYVTSTGNVQPCPGVEVAAKTSNIRENSLSWIIKNTKVFKDVRNIYSKLKGPCKSCMFSGCYGCRGTALFETGDYLASDPSCWWINKEQKDGIK